MSTILAVDDSITMRKCLEITFSGTEFNLVAVDNAQEALEKVKTLSPDLVIADVSLPPNDGYELCSTIKLAAPDLPVLMLSSKQNPFDPGRGAQADDHIDKPFDTQVMQDRARGLVKQTEKSDTDVPGAPAERPHPQPERAPITATGPQKPDLGAPASNKIPAPRRKRPTPAMMTNPLKPQQPTLAGQPGFRGDGPHAGSAAAAAMRRTVPFAMPGSAKHAGGARRIPTDAGGPAMTMPMGAREQAASEMLGRAAQPMAQRPQPAAAPGTARGPAGFEPAPMTPSPFTAQKAPPEKKPTGDTLPGVPQDGNRVASVDAHHGATGEGAWAGQAIAQLPADKAADLQTKLTGLGLTQQQVEGVLSLSREIIEQVVWDVVPTLAETLIKEEIRRLTKDS